MLTSFDQVRDWIIDNGLKRWILYKDYTKNDVIIDSMAFAVTDPADKLAMTEKYLRLTGGHAYAYGGTSGTKSDLNVYAEIRLSDITPLNSQAPQNVGAFTQDAIGQLRESITKELEAKWELKQYAKEKAEFERERKEFYDERNGVIGAVVKALSPYLPAINGALDQRRMVAGVDTEEPVHAAPIVPKNEPQETQEQAEQEQSPFTEEQEEKIYDLMVRFARVEPDYMRLLEAVVTMAENGDGTYKMAKGFLVK